VRKEKSEPPMNADIIDLTSNFLTWFRSAFIGVHRRSSAAIFPLSCHEWRFVGAAARTVFCIAKKYFSARKLLVYIDLRLRVPEKS
jgi:hypothetical protein